jgi:uncharacterized protein YjbI with pentapeptide repeats
LAFAAERQIVGQTSVTDEDDDRIWAPAEILRRYRAGERDFCGLKIESIAGSSEPEFRDAELEGADFSNCFIVADFTGARLQGARLSANVKTCSFDRADLRNADFSGAAIESATFDGADLEGANFEGAGDHSYRYRKGELPRS